MVSAVCPIRTNVRPSKSVLDNMLFLNLYHNYAKFNRYSGDTQGILCVLILLTLGFLVLLFCELSQQNSFLKRF